MSTEKIDLNQLTWESLPIGFDRSGTSEHLKSAEYTEPNEKYPFNYQFIVSIGTQEHDLGKAELALCISGEWYSTKSSKDWGEFDYLIGRKEWQQFLIDYAEENPLDACYYESDDEDDEDDDYHPYFEDYDYDEDN